MKPLLFFTYDHSLLPTMRKTIQENHEQPKILFTRMQSGSPQTQITSIF